MELEKLKHNPNISIYNKEKRNLTQRWKQELLYQPCSSPRIELFARQKTEGWDVFGNEVESDIQL